ALVRITFAATIAAPLLSVIAPRTDVVPTWAPVLLVKSARATRAKKETKRFRFATEKDHSIETPFDTLECRTEWGVRNAGGAPARRYCGETNSQSRADNLGDGPGVNEY